MRGLQREALRLHVKIRSLNINLRIRSGLRFADAVIGRRYRPISNRPVLVRAIDGGWSQLEPSQSQRVIPPDLPLESYGRGSSLAVMGPLFSSRPFRLCGAPVTEHGISESNGNPHASYPPDKHAKITCGPSSEERCAPSPSNEDCCNEVCARSIWNRPILLPRTTSTR
jgi:hypothetical protein